MQNAVVFYFFAKMIPFGFSGGGEYIQSNEDTFFSVFRITYAEQFVWNLSRGYIEDYGRNRSRRLLLDLAPYHGEDDKF